MPLINLLLPYTKPALLLFLLLVGAGLAGQSTSIWPVSAPPEPLPTFRAEAIAPVETATDFLHFEPGDTLPKEVIAQPLPDGYLKPARPSDFYSADSLEKNFNVYRQLNSPSTHSLGKRVAQLMTRKVNGSYGQCSCTMVSPYHAITAAHCVSDPDNPSRRTMAGVVRPAYNNGLSGFGEVELANWAPMRGYAEDGDHRYDLAIITLREPIGLYTGWASTGLIFSENDLKRFWQTNIAYPGEVISNGAVPFYRGGRFDRADRYYATHNSTSYGGTSGSAAAYFRPADGRYYLSSILSFGNNNYTSYVRIDGERQTSMGSYVLRAIPRGSSLIPVSGSLTQRPFSQSGRVISDVPYRFRLYNYGTNTYDGQLDVRYLLSTTKKLGQGAFYEVSRVRRSTNLFVATGRNYSGTVNLDARNVPPGCYYVMCRVVTGHGAEVVVPLAPGISDTRYCLDPAPYCAGVEELPGSEGRFNDGSGDRPYAQNSHCGWRMTDTTGQGELRLSFEEFDLRRGSEIFVYAGEPGAERLFARYSEDALPGGTLRTREGSFLVEFFTAWNDREGAGFSANYMTVPVRRNNLPATAYAPELSPNPSLGSVNVLLPNLGLDEEVPYRVYALSTGRTLYEGRFPATDRQQISLEGQPGGVYVLETYRDGKVYRNKITKR